MKIKKQISNLLMHRYLKNVGRIRDVKSSKKVLVSYITLPFISGSSQHHNNYQESIAIAEVFKEMGFTVDVIHYLDQRKIDYAQYQIIFGFGEPLVNSFYQTTTNLVRIYYGTGCHINHQNSATLERLQEVFIKTKLWMMSSGRIVEKSWSEQTKLVDAMVVLGNKFVLDTYRQDFSKPEKILQQPVSYICSTPPEDILNYRDITASKHNFIWFGSSGAIHKGLDLLLEAFSLRPHQHLHICGPLEREKEFMNFYQPLLNLPNIHYYGFVEINSPQFKKLMTACLFTIFPSCSEGQPGSVINVMATGIIPIVPKMAGINSKKYVIDLKKLNVQEILESIDMATTISNTKLSELSIKCSTDVLSSHSIGMYKQKLRKNLDIILESV